MKYFNFITRLPILLSGVLFLPMIAIIFGNDAGLPKISASIPFGFLFLFLGTVIFIDCTRIHFRLGQSSPDPFSKHTKLITKGFYHYSRNPMYLGYFAIILGQFLLSGQLLALLYLLGFIGFFRFYLVPKEEKKLKKNMGKKYLEYCRKTPRWLGFRHSDRKN